MKIWIDGQFYGKEDAKISVFDHGLLYGDGVFEGIRCYSGRVFRLAQHIDRLFGGLSALNLVIPYDREALSGLVVACIKENGLEDCYVRLVVTRGIGDLGLNPASCPKTSVIIIVGTIALYPAEHYTRGIDLCVSSWRRPRADVLNPQVKSLNYLNNIMARQEATARGCHEAILLNEQGLVAECSADNLFIVKDGTLMSPPLWCGALDGITRQAVIDCAGYAGIPFREHPMTVYDVLRADECFLTGTGAEIVPVRSLDGRNIPAPGPLTGRLRNEFSNLVKKA